MNRAWKRRGVLRALCAGAGAAMLPLAGCRRLGDGDQGSDLGAGIRFKDLTGHEIALARPARRIVDLWTVGTAFAIAAHGSPARIVGVNDRAHGIFKKGLVGRFFPEVFDIPDDVLIGGGAPNIERLVQLNPDVVIDYAHRPRTSADAMRNAGLRVARYAEAEGGICATVAALLRMYGQMVGDTARAERITDVMNETTAKLKGVQSIPFSARPRVLSFMPIGDQFHASGGGPKGLYSDFIYSAGGVNVAETIPGLAAVSAEQIAAWDPDVILIFQTTAARPSLVYDHPVLSGGRAARERRVYVLPIGANNWGAIGPDEFLSQVWLAELLHPARVVPNLRKDMRRAYAAIFDRTLSDDEINGVLRIDLNGQSAGYDRFL